MMCHCDPKSIIAPFIVCFVTVVGGNVPVLEYTFAHCESGAELVGAIGVMFTVAGQDDIRAIYPNISFKYFFEQN